MVYRAEKAKRRIVVREPVVHDWLPSYTEKRHRPDDVPQSRSSYWNTRRDSIEDFGGEE